RKWENKPTALATVESCRAGLAQIPAAVAGWRLTDLKCTGTSISASWTREKGVSSPPEKATLTDTGTSANLMVSLPAPAARGPESLIDPTEVTRRYLAQDWPGSLARASDDPPPPPPPNYQGPWSPPLPPWVKRSFTLTVPELPASLPAYFGNLPGIVINSVNFSGNGSAGMWTIEGVIYENRT
ncbi:MAG TPA: type 4b pilus protein PilO2, partial [Alphaproteobacteria bacterium]|nr:type 4b pilus protein PilO2 [Alphaproteobacteria bacterium]